VDEQQPEEIDGPASAKPTKAWIRPAVDRLDPGCAEASDGLTSEGGPTFS
jgi:hypothetical protein